jgi:hypothetical protein
LTAPVTCTVSAEQIAIQFPAEMKNDDLEADVWLYCIADKQKDIKRKFTTKEGKIIMPVLPANKGLHEIKMSWVSKGQTYYYKQKIVLK